MGLSTRIRTAVQSAGEWLRGNRERLTLLVGVFLATGLAFEGGLIAGRLRQAEPLTVSLPQRAVAEESQTIALSQVSQTSGLERVAAGLPTDAPKGACLYVGSKNSNKYHLPSCSFAKRIKPENRVCFASREEAEKKGYQPGCVK